MHIGYLEAQYRPQSSPRNLSTRAVVLQSGPGPPYSTTMLPSILLLLGLFVPNQAVYLCGQGHQDEWYSGFCTTKNMVSVDKSSLSHLYSQACLVDNSTNNLIYEFDNTNMLGCSERCSLAAACTTWTWWGDTEVCQLFSSCSKDRSDCCDCQTGPR